MKMKHLIFYIAFISVLAAVVVEQRPLEADAKLKFTWPIELGSYPELKGITSTFAESRTDHFHNGLDIAALNHKIYPVASGHLLYSRHTSDDPFRPEEGPGNYIFVSHGKGWLSGYYHLRGDRPMVREGALDRSGILAYTGNSGHSGGAHLHFFMASKNGSVIHNPLTLLPPVTDEHPPVIGQLLVQTAKGRTLISHSREENIRLTRAYPFQITVIDPGLEKHTRRGVYELRWKLNDHPWQVRQFSRLVFQDGKWLLDSKYDFSVSFRHNLYNLGVPDWLDGMNLLLVRARDYAGNESEVKFHINLKKEY